MCGMRLILEMHDKKSKLEAYLHNSEQLLFDTVKANLNHYLSLADNLYPALVECFGIIILGFIAGKFNFINDVEAKGITESRLT